jgi:hypothetical protein
VSQLDRKNGRPVQLDRKKTLAPTHQERPRPSPPPLSLESSLHECGGDFVSALQRLEAGHRLAGVPVRARHGTAMHSPAYLSSPRPVVPPRAMQSVSRSSTL